jgi:hypothetical protein
MSELPFPQVSLIQLGIGEIGTAQTGAAHVGKRDISTVRDDQAEVAGEEVRLAQFGAHETSLTKSRRGEIRRGQVASGEIEAGQIAIRQIGAPPTRTRPKEQHVRVKHFLEFSTRDFAPRGLRGISRVSH